MLVAIDLKDELVSEADEIDDICPERNLSPKVSALLGKAFAKQNPKSFFGFGERLA